MHDNYTDAWVSQRSYARSHCGYEPCWATPQTTFQTAIRLNNPTQPNLTSCLHLPWQVQMRLCGTEITSRWKQRWPIASGLNEEGNNIFPISRHSVNRIVHWRRLTTSFPYRIDWWSCTLVLTLLLDMMIHMYGLSFGEVQSCRWLPCMSNPWGGVH